MSSTKVKGEMSTVQDILESLQISTEEGNQISDKKVQDTSSKSTSEKEQTAPSSIEPSCIKSYSESQIDSTILEHTWKINQFKHFCKLRDQLESPSFSKKGQFILMEIFKHKTDQSLRVIRFYIRTDEAFYGACTTTIIYPPETILSSNSITGHIRDNILLIELSQFNIKEFDDNCALIVRCKFEIFHHFVSNNIQMKLLPPSTVFSNNAKYLEESTLDKIELENGESIRFIIAPERYIISKKLLCATNSTYFKNICLTHEKEVKEVIYDLDCDEEKTAFKQILLYIKTGSLPAELCHNYEMLQVLLRTADIYDVPALKLMCEHYLLRHITIENAIELTQLAVSTNAKFLETRAAAFTQFCIKKIADTEEFSLETVRTKEPIYKQI